MLVTPGPLDFGSGGFMEGTCVSDPGEIVNPGEAALARQGAPERHDGPRKRPDSSQGQHNDRHAIPEHWSLVP